MKQAILLSLLLLAACASSPRPTNIKPILGSHNIVVYRGTDSPIYRVPNDNKTCWLNPGEYFKTKTRKLGVNSPFMQGGKTIVITEDGYYKIDKASDSTWMLHRYTIIKIADAKAKEEIAGMKQVCLTDGNFW